MIPAATEATIMARVLTYRYFNADITPTSLYYDMVRMTGHQWEDSILAKWNRQLYGPTPGWQLCWGCKEVLHNWAVRGIGDVCCYCSEHFRKLPPGPQAMLLATGHDARLMLYTFQWNDQELIYWRIQRYMKVHHDHGILPQSYKQRVSQEDVKPAGAIVQHAPDTSCLPAPFRA